MSSTKKYIAMMLLGAMLVGVYFFWAFTGQASASCQSHKCWQRVHIHRQTHWVNTKAGPHRYAKYLVVHKYKWPKSEYYCVNALWNRESGWKVYAHNPSGAHGIPQALPGAKMASAGPRWWDNFRTQIKWGLSYIKSKFITPCNANAFQASHNYY